MTAPPAALRALPWQGEITAEPLLGGLSNESWKVTDAAGAHVVRFGRDYPFHHVDRAREVMVARAAHAAGFGPRVEHATPGVSVVEFLNARTWGPEDLRANPERLGDLLRRFHRDMPAHIAGAAFLFWPFHVIRDYARTLRAGDSAFTPDLPAFLSLNAELEAAQIPLPLIFGHHDLLPANFLDDGSRLWLIDYEYAGFGTALFDLAGAASNAGMTPDETDRLLIAYFGTLPDTPLRRAFDAMQCTSLLREAMWAMVSDLHLAAPGADYKSYARENLDRLDAALSQYHSRHGSKT
ncbi:phosphotransferase [Rhodobacter sp. HX-7-19]|uniref:Phosphotransferase n=1 Tax=Paragemmobacter kunshanensis TaxID=2583234 RepID=A0A6M1TWL5_9RHOB|nr:phosphotransferase [Rhodobacter kunshanensis]NGQ92738.1 phosphotransferase [Rhodobacter kunshanensis]